MRAKEFTCVAESRGLKATNLFWEVRFSHASAKDYLQATRDCLVCWQPVGKCNRHAVTILLPLPWFGLVAGAAVTNGSTDLSVVLAP